ncbi:hypothetical protein Syun_003027 [Stephania yunnanensis]|uniref:Uncharacterized protein n=1 Tax=Stephania yunnanensis TaxID=152371 RepID=A0AAP0L1G6_9MAGN
MVAADLIYSLHGLSVLSLLSAFFMLCTYKNRDGRINWERESSVKGQVRWNDRMDKILLEIILKEYGFGNASSNSWKPEVYTRVCLELLKQLKQQVHQLM